MDGVIINSEPVHQRLEFEMYEELGLNISPEEHKNYVGTSAIDMWIAIKAKHGLQKTPEELLLYGRSKYWDALDRGEVHLVEGARDLIETFFQEGFTIQVASSATRPTVDKVMEHFSLQSYFSHRVGGDEVKKSKPDPEIFMKAAAQSGSDPSACLVIEDSTNGVKAALLACMKAIGYINPGTGKQDLSNAHATVTSLNQIDSGLIQSL